MFKESKSPNVTMNGDSSTKPRSYIELMEDVQAAITPKPASFIETVYPTTEVQSDMKQLQDFRNTPEFKHGEERSDSKLLEKTFTDMAEQDDWFHEDELYGDDPDYLMFTSVPTSEIDDTFNHIDAICMICNETTNHEVLPFAIDLTYNTDPSKMSQKFKWKHVYGKKSSAPESISEFGSSSMEQSPRGERYISTSPLPLRYRYGLKIPGFASAKYFEDTNSLDEPLIEKGRIKLMPRLVVGYSPDIADIIARGKPTDEIRQKYGDQVFEQRKEEYRDATLRAKWCTLFECLSQASAIKSMLDNLSDEEISRMDPQELDEAKKQITMLHDYLKKAVDTASKEAKSDPRSLAAIKYADRDTVRNAIESHSISTYERQKNRKLGQGAMSSLGRSSVA